MVVEKFPWANTLDVTRGVDQALDEMRPGLPGIHIDNHIFRPAEFIEISISNLTDALLLGTLLVVLVLVAFLFEWRAAADQPGRDPAVADGRRRSSSTPRGATINTMVLAGFVIARRGGRRRRDHRHREHRAAGCARTARPSRPGPSSSVMLEASLEVRRAIVYATLIIVARGHARCSFVTGVTGRVLPAARHCRTAWRSSRRWPSR